LVISEEFENFIDNIKVKNSSDISVSYKGVTKKLNQTFYESDSEDNNSLQVGSYGRKTAIHGISDLDMIFILPKEIYVRFNGHDGNSQSALLQEVRKTLKEKYPASDIKVDGQVVVFNHTEYRIEVLPVFKENDGSYTFPDTHNGGSWKTTKPVEEIEAIKSFDNETVGTLKELCRMVRSWKDYVGAPIGGLLIDTICFDFLNENSKYYNTQFDKFDELSKAFFEYLSATEQERVFWYAPGSNQKVEKKGDFVPKAKKALKNCNLAIENSGKELARNYWKKIYGRSFPVKVKEESNNKALSESGYRNTEQFIEDLFSVNISENLIIDCTVSQDGFREMLLSKVRFLKNKFHLEFFIHSSTAKEPYDVYWKVRNIGPVAEKRDSIRGQIERDKGQKKRKETSNFDGDHFVECFIIKNNVVIARDIIDVNISEVEH